MSYTFKTECIPFSCSFHKPCLQRLNLKVTLAPSSPLHSFVQNQGPDCLKPMPSSLFQATASAKQSASPSCTLPSGFPTGVPPFRLGHFCSIPHTAATRSSWNASPGMCPLCLEAFPDFQSSPASPGSRLTGFCPPLQPYLLTLPPHSLSKGTLNSY